jgi:hypothetical protein
MDRCVAHLPVSLSRDPGEGLSRGLGPGISKRTYHFEPLRCWAAATQ